MRDEAGLVRAWGSVHDRASGRMLFVHVVDRALDERTGRACSDVLVEWAVGQAREVGTARGLATQQIDTGAYVDDERQHRWLAASGFTHVRTWWQMSRPVTADEAGLVEDPAHWEKDGVVVRLTEGEDDWRAVHDVLEAAFTDHFNSKPETFDEFLFRLREDPGHRWDHWWLASHRRHQPVGRPGRHARARPGGSYVAYVGVVEAARGRGRGQGAAAHGHRRRRRARTATASASRWTPTPRPAPTGSTAAWAGRRRYVTQSWHRDVPHRAALSLSG